MKNAHTQLRITDASHDWPMRLIFITVQNLIRSTMTSENYCQKCMQKSSRLRN